MENARSSYDTPTAGMSAGGTPSSQPMADRAHEAVDRMADTAHSAAEQMSAQADQLMIRARDYVREKPMTAIGIALAAGFILSRLSR